MTGSVLERMAVVANTDWFLFNFLSEFLTVHLRHGVAARVISPRGPYVEQLIRLGVSWAEVPMERGRGSLWNSVASIRSLARTLRQFHPDVVHLITAKPVILGNWAVDGDVSAVNVLPGLGRSFASSGLTSSLDRLAIRWGVRRALDRPRSRAVFHQASDRERILGSSSRLAARTSLIPGWGVNLDRFAGPRLPQHPPLVVMISRMLWTKGVGNFVKAAGQCQRSIDARFVLVGDPDPGNPDAVPVSTLQEWESGGLVERWGHRADVPAILARASICVLPSKYGEGVPQSLVEAAAAGVPIIASDIPGCREVVDHGRNGLLITPGDVKGLTEAMLALLRSPAELDEMGKAGPAVARERFSTVVIFDAYRRLYEAMGLQLGGG